MLLDYLYPPACVLCGELMPLHGSWEGVEKKQGYENVCARCEKKLTIINEPTCLRCGKSVESAEQEYCFDCEKREFSFQRNRSVFPYEGQVRKAMHDFKYAHRRENGAFFSEALMKYLGPWMKSLNVEVIIPIPIHNRRNRRRGYNQAGLLAQRVGVYLQVPVDEDILGRLEYTKPQNRLGKKERKINVKNAFKILENEVQYDRVLLIDDIYTTGATLNGAAEALRAAGVREIYCATVCIGKGY